MPETVILLPDERAERFINRLKLLQSSADRAYSHIEADRILCELLTELNFSDVVEEWIKVQKAYA